MDNTNLHEAFGLSLHEVKQLKARLRRPKRLPAPIISEVEQLDFGFSPCPESGRPELRRLPAVAERLGLPWK